MMSIDHRQLTQAFQKAESELRQEYEKVRALKANLEDEVHKRQLLLEESKERNEENTKLKMRVQELLKDLSEYREVKKSLDDEICKLKVNISVNELQAKELQDQLEAEQYFSSLYKTQLKESKEELEERQKSVQDLTEERNKLSHQLDLLNARADAESRARRLAEETQADLEKEKDLRELEMQEMERRLRSEISLRDGETLKLRDRESELNSIIHEMTRQKEEMKDRLKTLEEGKFL